MAAARRFDGARQPPGERSGNAEPAYDDGPSPVEGLAYCGVPSSHDPVPCGPECPHCHPDGASDEPGARPRAATGEECPVQAMYGGITVGENMWIQRACQEAVESVRDGGGPFGAVVVQVGDQAGQVLRYWRGRNRVTQSLDPTAHAEITALRAACRDLGTYDLGAIRRSDPAVKLPQQDSTSHCEIYCSCEPCPMCYAAIRWARIPVIVFAATRFAAAEPGVDFSDLQIYEELATAYRDRDHLGLRVRRSATPAANDAFQAWRKSDNARY